MILQTKGGDLMARKRIEVPGNLPSGALTLIALLMVIAIPIIRAVLRISMPAGAGRSARRADGIGKQHWMNWWVTVGADSTCTIPEEEESEGLLCILNAVKA
jgi:hypothetical protein